MASSDYKRIEDDFQTKQFHLELKEARRKSKMLECTLSSMNQQQSSLSGILSNKEFEIQRLQDENFKYKNMYETLKKETARKAKEEKDLADGKLKDENLDLKQRIESLEKKYKDLYDKTESKQAAIEYVMYLEHALETLVH